MTSKAFVECFFQLTSCFVTFRRNTDNLHRMNWEIGCIDYRTNLEIASVKFCTFPQIGIAINCTFRKIARIHRTAIADAPRKTPRNRQRPVGLPHAGQRAVLQRRAYRHSAETPIAKSGTFSRLFSRMRMRLPCDLVLKNVMYCTFKDEYL